MTGQDIWRQRIARLSEDAPFVIVVWRKARGEQGFRLEDSSADLAARFDLPVHAPSNDPIWIQRVHPDDRQSLAALLASKTTRLKYTFRIARVGGGWRWVEAACHVEKLEDGSLEAVGYLSDASEQRGREERLQQSARLVMLGEMATGMAHELNQPLNVIRLAGENALHRVPDSTEDPLLVYLGDKLRRIIAQTVRASRIVDRMRIFGRRTDQDSGVIEVRKLIEDAIALVEPQFRAAGLTIALVIEDTIPPLYGDRAQLRQALANILLNAMDAVTDRLTQSPDLRANPESVAVHASWDSAKQRISLKVADKGVGIPRELTTRVLEPFFTTKPTGSGVGLGLSISYGIVRDHDGDLEIANLDDGAAITLLLKPYAPGVPG